MKIAKPSKMQALVDKKLGSYREIYGLHELKGIEKYNKYSHMFVMGSTCIFVLLFLILDYFDVLELSNTFLVSGSSQIMIVATITFAVFIMSGIMAPMHEIIHYLLFPRKQGEVYLIFRLPKLIAIFFDGFLTKKRHLIVQLAPFIVINILILVFNNFITDRAITILLIQLNFLTSGSDIFMFFDVLFNAPSKSYIYAGYYTTDDVGII